MTALDELARLLEGAKEDIDAATPWQVEKLNAFDDGWGARAISAVGSYPVWCAGLGGNDNAALLVWLRNHAEELLALWEAVSDWHTACEGTCGNTVCAILAALEEPHD